MLYIISQIYHNNNTLFAQNYQKVYTISSMPMKDLLKKKLKPNDSDLIVAVDIGTEVVKALVARVKGTELEIIGVGRKAQEIGDMHSGAIADISAVVANCEIALSEAEDMAGVQGRRAVMGIAGELVKGQTSTVRYRRPQPDKVLDITEMEFIIEKVQERAQAKAQAQIAFETGNPDVEVKLVNSALVSIHIDGYKVSNPIGFQGKDVAIQIYTAFAPMVHIGALEKVADELALELVAVAAEPFAVSRSVVGIDSNSSFTAILVDVGGGTTDIAVVNDGGVEGTKMFGIGGRSFTRTIASDMGISYKDAEKLKINLQDSRIKPDIRRQVSLSVDKTMEVWLSGVELSLGEFDNIDHLPNRILLCGGGSSLGQLVDALEKNDWYKTLPFTKRPTIKHIKPSEVAGVIDTTGEAIDHTFITAMGLLRVGYDTIAENSTGDNFMDKINRLLRI